MRRLPFAFVAALVLSFSFFSGVALAIGPYFGSGYFPTSNLKWNFYGVETDSGGSYKNPALNATYRWNVDTDITLSSTTGTDWHARVHVGPWGSTGWTGYAYICSINGACDSTSADNSTYKYCQAKINTTYLFDDTQIRRQNTITHELGHCWSLAHLNDLTSVMYPSQTDDTTPNANDIASINARY